MDTTLNHATTTITTLSNHPKTTATHSARVLENGTIIGAIIESNKNSNNNNTNAKLTGNSLVIPEIVISGSYSSQSLNQNRFPATETPSAQEDDAEAEEETAVESTALLQKHEQQITPKEAVNTERDPLNTDEFEQFVLNRSTSESNILESSIYSELQFPITAPNSETVGRTTTLTTTPPTTVVDLLNTSACSRESARLTTGGKRTRRKHKSKSKRDAATAAAAAAAAAAPILVANYPPQYTAIFLDHLQQQQQSGDTGGSVVANAMGQIASAAAASPFLNAPVAGTDPNAYMQHPFYSHPMLIEATRGHHRHHRARLDPTELNAIETGSLTTSASNSSSSSSGSSSINAASSALHPALRINFRKWFTRPSLPFIIGILALGGVACTLGGIVLGSTGLIEHSTQYLSAALLMIGIGVSLLVISGAIWRLSLPDDTDECPCYRHMETCRNCNSPYCNNRLMAGGFYPEFQHRPPPPSYLTSLNECAAMGLLFHPAAAAPQAAYSTLRMNTPPPLYRSTNSLSVFVPGSNSTNTIATSSCTLPSNSIIPALPSTGGQLLSEHAVLTMSAVMENLQAQQQALTKELNYLELD